MPTDLLKTGPKNLLMGRVKPQSDLQGVSAAATSGLTLGFADEIGAGVATVASYLDPREEAQSAFQGQSFGERYRGIRDQARENMTDYAEANPGKAMAAEIGGGLLTGGAGASRIAGAKGLDLVARTTGTGAALGGTSGVGFSEANSAEGVLDDGKQGALIGGAMGGMFTGAGQGLAKLGEKFASTADDVGMRLTPGQRFDSDVLKRIEASGESFFLTSGAFSKLKQGNQRALNRVAAESIGESADDLSGDVLGRAYSNLQSEFQRLTRGREVPLDNAFIGKVNAVQRQLSDRSYSKATKKALKFIDGTLKKDIAKGPTITDEVYQDLSSEIAEAMRSKATKGKSKKAFGELKDALDDLFERSLGGDELAAFRDARAKWKNLLKVQSVVSDGDVSGLKLANKLAKEDPAGYLRGGNDSPLYEAARAAQKYKSIVGDSGTATRMSLPMIGVLGAGGYGVGTATGMDPQTAALLAAMSPLAARAYIRSGRLPTGRTLSDPRLVAPAANAGLLTQGP